MKATVGSAAKRGDSPVHEQFLTPGGRPKTNTVLLAASDRVGETSLRYRSSISLHPEQMTDIVWPYCRK